MNEKCIVCGSDGPLTLIDDELLCSPCATQKLVAEAEQEDQLWSDLRARDGPDAQCKQCIHKKTLVCRSCEQPNPTNFEEV